MPEEIIRRKRRLSSFQIIILGFAGVILLGALLLMLPISTNGRNVTPFNETLFTATSAVCVTGLVVQDTGSYWSTFGPVSYTHLLRGSRAALPIACDALNARTMAIREYHYVSCVSSLISCYHRELVT